MCINFRIDSRAYACASVEQVRLAWVPRRRGGGERSAVHSAAQATAKTPNIALRATARGRRRNTFALTCDFEGLECEPSFRDGRKRTRTARRERDKVKMHALFLAVRVRVKHALPFFFFLVGGRDHYTYSRS